MSTDKPSPTDPAISPQEGAPEQPKCAQERVEEVAEILETHATPGALVTALNEFFGRYVKNECDPRLVATVKPNGDVDVEHDESGDGVIVYRRGGLWWLRDNVGREYGTPEELDDPAMEVAGQMLCHIWWGDVDGTFWGGRTTPSDG